MKTERGIPDRRLLPLIAALALLAGAPPAPAQELQVTSLVRIGPTGLTSTAFGINDHGHVVGFFFSSVDSLSHPFVVDQNGTRDLLDEIGGSSLARAINNEGLIVGQTLTLGSAKGFVFEDGAVTFFERGAAAALNDSRLLVGTAQFAPNFTIQAARFAGETASSLGTLTSSGSSAATAVNADGVIVGFATASDNREHAVRFEAGGGVTSLHSQIGPAGGESRAFGINASGQIVGTVYGDDGPAGFLLDETGVFRFGNITTVPTAINNRGDIVGSTKAATFSDPSRAFLLTDGIRFDLTTLAGPLLAAAGFASLDFAEAINNRRQIVGQGTLTSGRKHAFRLDLGATAIWEGVEGFAFGNAPNWEGGFVPGPTDIAVLRFPGQARTIQLAPAEIVTTARLLADNASETELQLGGGVWRVAGGGGVDSAFAMNGATVTVRNGTLEIFGGADLAGDSPTNNVLEAVGGGKVIVREGGLLVDAADGRSATLLVQGEGSLLEADGARLGFGGGGEVSALVTDGGTFAVGGEFDVGGFGDAEVVVTGRGASGERSTLRVTGDEVRVGPGAGEGSLILENGGGADLGDATVTLGASGAPSAARTVGRAGGGLLAVTGEDSSLAATGEIRVLTGGVLRVAAGTAALGTVNVDGGLAAFRDGAQVSGGVGSELGVKVGGIEVTSDATVSMDRLAVEAGGLLRIDSGGQVRINGADNSSLIGFAAPENPDAQRALVEIVGASADRPSTLRTTGDLVVGFLGEARVNVSAGGALEVGGHLRVRAEVGDPLAAVAVGGAGSTITAAGLQIGLSGEATSPAAVLVGTGATLSVRPGEAGTPGATTIHRGGDLFVEGTASLGRVTLTGGSLQTLTAEARALATSVEVNGGRVVLADGRLETPTLTMNDGELRGRGRIVGSLVMNGGFVTAGLSPGTLTIEGDFVQNGGRIVMEIGGLTPGTQFDQLVVTGDFSLLDGTIELAFTDGFAPRAGETFALFDVAGAFTSDAAFAVSGLEDGWQFDTAFDPATGGFTITSLTDAVAVPEPGVVALLLTAAAGLVLRQSRRRSRVTPMALAVVLTATNASAEPLRFSLEQQIITFGGSSEFFRQERTETGEVTSQLQTLSGRVEVETPAGLFLRGAFTHSATVSDESVRSADAVTRLEFFGNPDLAGAMAKLIISYAIAATSTETIERSNEGQPFASSSARTSLSFFTFDRASSTFGEGVDQAFVSRDAVPVAAGDTLSFIVDLGHDIFIEMRSNASASAGNGPSANASFNSQLAFTLGPLAVTWEGAEGFDFRTGGNWSGGVAPGASDTVQLTAAGQLRTIEFAAGDFVTNQRLLAGSDSETVVDLNASLWRLDGAANPAPTGQMRVAGASLEIRDGTLEVFGRVETGNDGASANLLSLTEGGKLVVRADDFVAGVGGGFRDTLLEIVGPGSQLQARDIVLGAAGGTVTALVSGGGALVADRALTIGGTGAGAVAVTGAGPITGSFVQVAEGGRLTLGGAAAGSLSISDGASAILTDVDVAIREHGSFALSGTASRVSGGRFTVGDGGTLTLADAPTIVQSVTAEGGAVFLRHGAIVNAGAVAIAGGGSFTVESRATGIAATLDVAAVGAPDGATGIARVEGGGHLRVAGAARVGGSSGGSGLLEITGRDGDQASRLTAEADLVIGGAGGVGRLLVEDGASAVIAGSLGVFTPASEGEDAPRSRVEVLGSGSALAARDVLLFASGTVEVGAGASLTVSNATTIGGGSAVFVSGNATLGTVNVLANDGPIFALISPAARVSAASLTVAGGTVAIVSGAQLTVPTLTMNGGILSGRGRVVGNVVQNGGEILPGQSPGTLTIEGDFIQNGGRIVMEIGGLTPGMQFDQLVVTGDFSLTSNGVIELAFVDGFAPAAGETFALFDVDGAFDSDAAFAVSGLEDGWQFDTAFDPATGGFTLTSLTDAVAVPEPGALALLAVAALLAFLRHRRRFA